MAALKHVNPIAPHQLKLRARTHPASWLITGGAGFIGSNITELLLRENQRVVVLDNLSTGYAKNLDEVRALVGPRLAENLTFIHGDIGSLDTCKKACERIDYVLHQAALGSVPRSIAEPLASHQANVNGFLNMLEAARMSEVKAFVYASSSSVYGDSAELPKVEANIGKQLSPYAGTKRINEVYADIWTKTYGLRTIGLRYFNVFGPRQDPSGAYAAVIPKWISTLLNGQKPLVNGDGETSRDFCFVNNAVQANVLAALAESNVDLPNIFNVSIGGRMTLNQLFTEICRVLTEQGRAPLAQTADYGPFRKGDITHSNADIASAMNYLGYEPTHDVLSGLRDAMPWYLKHLN